MRANGAGTPEPEAGLEPALRDLQSRALPLGDPGVEHVGGLEPPFSGWKPDVLPLDDTRKFDPEGFREPHRASGSGAIGSTRSCARGSNPASPPYQGGVPPLEPAQQVGAVAESAAQAQVQVPMGIANAIGDCLGGPTEDLNSDLRLAGAACSR